ncbi:unnamed protein product [Rhizoctonia solani]|uniref:Uncharacterized protein n=1 Tax=Rhizoctonia solani TaxID=456999 RepID=A0A8H3BFD5_9AGAM|nr:unnamed protein product [Rhizoctonia solani]
MRFSILVILCSYVMLGFATPVFSTKNLVVKRDDTSITGVLTKLKSSITAPASEIDNLLATKTANQDNVGPCINLITTALQTAVNELRTLKSSAHESQSNDAVGQVANEVVNLLIKIGADLLLGVPVLGMLLGPLVTGLALLLSGLLALLPGLPLDANLLNDAAQLFNKVSPGLSLDELAF